MVDSGHATNRPIRCLRCANIGAFAVVPLVDPLANDDRREFGQNQHFNLVKT